MRKRTSKIAVINWSTEILQGAYGSGELALQGAILTDQEKAVCKSESNILSVIGANLMFNSQQQGPLHLGFAFLISKTGNSLAKDSNRLIG